VENGSPGIVPVVIGGKAVVGRLSPIRLLSARGSARHGARRHQWRDADSDDAFLDDLNNQESQQIVEQTMAHRLDGPVDQSIAVDVVDESGARSTLSWPHAAQRDAGPFRQFAGDAALLRIEETERRHGLYPVQRISGSGQHHAAVSERVA